MKPSRVEEQPRRRRICCWAAAFLLGTLAAGTTASSQLERKPQPRPIVILGGTLVDGSGAAARHNDAIVVAEGRIKAMGLDAWRRAPKDARQIDATGKWIIPGLIDGDVHLFRSGGLDARPDLVRVPGAASSREIAERIHRNPSPYLRAYVCSGVTAVVDIAGPGWVADLRDSREDDALSPRIAISGPALATLVPAPLQLGTGEPFWRMESIAGVKQQVAELAARRPSLVAIRWSFEPDAVEGDSTLIRAAIDEAHRAKLPVVVETEAIENARRAVSAGADALLRGPSDAEIDEALLKEMAQRRVSFIPALLGARGLDDVRRRRTVLEPIETRCATEATIESLKLLESPLAAVEVVSPARPDPLPRLSRNLKRLADAGVTVVAGSDAGNLRAPHGPSLHRELALMSDAGMAPIQVLRAATGNGALLMRREREIGQVRPGMLADIVLLDADPLADIRNTQRIAIVIRGGTIYER